jgi:isocitrate/isopropylmalate dehydrogenase
MTAEQIIEDIKLLPREEQSRVVQFAVALARARQIPAEELVVIAQKMLDSEDQVEKRRLEADLTRGFYGD